MVEKMNDEKPLLTFIYWLVGSGVIGALAAISYHLSDKAKRSELDRAAIIGVLLGSYLSTVSAFILLVRVMKLDEFVALAIVIPITLMGGSAGLVILKVAWKRFGFSLPEVNKEDDG